LPAARRALRHKLQDRHAQHDAVCRTRGTMFYVGHRHQSRPIAAALAMAMTSAFPHDGACALRIRGCDCRFASP
jgi:hypothetical protein